MRLYSLNSLLFFKATWNFVDKGGISLIRGTKIKITYGMGCPPSERIVLHRTLPSLLIRNEGDASNGSVTEVQKEEK